MTIYNINELIKSNLIYIAICIIIIFAITVVHYFFWYKHNFNKVTIDAESYLLIEGREDNHLSIEISKLIVPSEDILLLNLNLKFSEFIKEELIENSYTLIFKKPEDLEVKLMKNVKIISEIINDGLNNAFYCINLNYRNNKIDRLLFELQADESTIGDLEIYFFSGKINKDFEKNTAKKSPIFNEEIYSKNVKISQGNCIIIDKR